MLATPLNRLLEFIILPSLTTLFLVGDRNWSSKVFQTFLHRSTPRIEHFGHDSEDTTENEMIERLKLLPFIRTLDLPADAGYNRHYERKPQVGSTFCDSLQEWDTASKRFVICPELETLRVDYKVLNNMSLSITVFADMVEERWHRSRAARKNFKLEMKNVYDVGGRQPKLLAKLHRIPSLKKVGYNVTID